jgi:hypothetical protein
MIRLRWLALLFGLAVVMYIVFFATRVHPGGQMVPPEAFFTPTAGAA